MNTNGVPQLPEKFTLVPDAVLVTAALLEVSPRVAFTGFLLLDLLQHPIGECSKGNVEKRGNVLSID
jgi:hypothetical protein